MSRGRSSEKLFATQVEIGAGDPSMKHVRLKLDRAALSEGKARLRLPRDPRIDSSFARDYSSRTVID